MSNKNLVKNIRIIMLKILLIILCFSRLVFSQYNLDYFINKALDNSPAIKNYNNLFLINDLQRKLDEAQNSSFQVSLTGNYLFAPYFNNNGKLISTNPDPEAIGYDIGITNGGLYSAQINVEKNIFNGSLLDALKQQRLTINKSYENKSDEEKHTLKKEVADQYLNTLQELLLYNLSQKIVSNLTNQLSIAGNQVQNGYVKAQDYLLLKVELTTEQIDLNETRQNYNSGLLQLYSLCGIKDTQIVKIDSVEFEQNITKPGNSNFLTKFYLDSLNAANQQQIFETKYQPQIGLFFNTGLNAVELENIQRKFGLSAGINFALPILDGGQKDITRQQTTIVEKSLTDYKNYLAQNISLQQKNSQDRINFLKKNLDDIKEQIKDYDVLLNISKKQLNEGNLSMVEYLTLLKNYFDLQKKQINTLINYQIEINNYNYWNY